MVVAGKARTYALDPGSEDGVTGAHGLFCLEHGCFRVADLTAAR